MTLIQQAPAPKIEIYSHDIPSSLKIVLSVEYASTTETIPPFIQMVGATYYSPHLLSYSFSESVQDLQGSCSFSVAGGDNNVYDYIQPLDIIKIYEGGNTPAFIGVINTKSISCSMSDNGLKRSINFSGKSITSLIAEFQLILDSKLLSAGRKVLNASDVSKDITIELNNLQSNIPLTLKAFLEKTWELYLKYTGVNKPKGEVAGSVSGHAGGSNIAVYNIINAFMGRSFFEIGNALSLPMPITNTFFNQNINTVLQIWQCILAPPVYEIFSRVNSYGLPKIVVREAPFDASDWVILPKKIIKASELIDYTLHLSNNEVYSVYLAYLEGSQLDADQYIVIEASEANKQGESIFAVDEEKFRIYGMKMCQVNFRGYEKTKKNDSITKTMQKYSKRLKGWFGHLDEMHMGSITIVNNLKDIQPKIRVGDRVGFLGGEFYVRNTEHSWSYEGIPTITAQITRGGKYTPLGKFEAPLKKIGTTRIELENESLIGE